MSLLLQFPGNSLIFTGILFTVTESLCRCLSFDCACYPPVKLRLMKDSDVFFLPYVLGEGMADLDIAAPGAGLFPEDIEGGLL